MLITAHGHSGHSSVLHNDTAVEKLNYIMNKFLDWRRMESWKLNGLNYPYGNVTAINLTILKGGIKSNVVPPEMSVLIDMRLAIDSVVDEIENMVRHVNKNKHIFVISIVFFLDKSLGKRSGRKYHSRYREEYSAKRNGHRYIESILERI